MKMLIFSVMGLFLLLPTPARAQQVQVQIKECEACHGPGGVSSDDDIPSLAGMDAGGIVSAMEEFHYYERHCTTTTYRHGDRPKTPLNMCNVANTLSDRERRELAEYFAAQ
ncbi:MAG: hypothetical protein OES53_08525 [Xanthomonadales bacterium]|jgi:sulfide dehydrogenase cytochrome subunit|nr:hypothetical protein [Xanthomonadales bacterium]MDH3923408.1 hypothetical protein [Xanthomonadales bacterium]MDH4001859.1 hypothetical protein [Xanthomonadales bacterium]